MCCTVHDVSVVGMDQMDIIVDQRINDTKCSSTFLNFLENKNNYDEKMIENKLQHYVRFTKKIDKYYENKNVISFEKMAGKS